jgi:hypothetical protein
MAELPQPSTATLSFRDLLNTAEGSAAGLQTQTTSGKNFFDNPAAPNTLIQEKRYGRKLSRLKADNV